MSLLSRHCCGDCAIDLTVSAYVSHDEFLSVTESPTLSRYALIFYFMPKQSGRLRRLPDLAPIRALNSCHAVDWHAPVDQSLPRVPGSVTLIHQDQGQLARDLQTLREIETNGFYQLA
jgi:hypothetical protein